MLCLRNRLPQLLKRVTQKAKLAALLAHQGKGMSCRAASTLNISGLYPPIATPFNADESIAYDKLQFNINKWNTIPFRGYVVQGSNGEYIYLTQEERVEIVKQVKSMAAPDKLVIAGSGCESTSSTIEMSKKMASAGADAVLVVTPCFYKANMTNDAMVAHYTKVADSAPVPVILYSVPANTGLDLSPEVVVKLASHPNIIGLKDSGGDVSKLASLVFKTKDKDFQILAGSAGFLLPAYTIGCVGGVLALANILGQDLCNMVDLFQKGNMAEAKALQQRLVAPNASVTRSFGVAGLKSAMDDLGYYGGPARLPILPLTDAQRATQRQVFKDSGYM